MMKVDTMSKELKKTIKPSLNYCRWAIKFLRGKNDNNINMICLVIYEYDIICRRLSNENDRGPIPIEATHKELAEIHNKYQKKLKTISAFTHKHFSLFDSFFKGLYKAVDNSIKPAFRFKDYYNIVLVLCALRSLYTYGDTTRISDEYIRKHIPKSQLTSLVYRVWYEFEQEDNLKASSIELTCIEIIFNALLTDKIVPQNALLGGSRILFSYCDMD